MRSMGLLLDERWRSEAFCSNIKLKNASIFAINSLRSWPLLAKSAPHCKQLNEVLEKITNEIRTGGTISFARFMELALYCPDYGYYEREKDIFGRQGDYYTNVSVGR